MAKVRVPKYKRPPTRFGVITSGMGTFPDPETIGKRFRVKGVFVTPKKGDWFWYGIWGTGKAKFDFIAPDPRVILERVK